MNPIDLSTLSKEDLYNLGKHIGAVAKERPDVTHQILIGVRDGVVKTTHFNGYGFGEILWSLWRHWHHGIGARKNPLIPFASIQGASGDGKL